jgi:hypothetical protein
MQVLNSVKLNVIVMLLVVIPLHKNLNVILLQQTTNFTKWYIFEVRLIYSVLSKNDSISTAEQGQKRQDFLFFVDIKIIILNLQN